MTVSQIISDINCWRKGVKDSLPRYSSLHEPTYLPKSKKRGGGGMLFLASLSVCPSINIQRFLLYNLLLLLRERSGSRVGCLTRD